VWISKGKRNMQPVLLMLQLKGKIDKLMDAKRRWENLISRSYEL
jgi:hypothetical protein